MKAGHINSKRRAIRGRALGAMALVAAMASHTLAQTPGFVLIPPAPGFKSTIITSLSPDGVVVWGGSSAGGSSSRLNFRWTAEGGRVDVPTPPEYLGTTVVAFSGNGEVGAVQINPTASTTRGGRYSTDRGFEMLPVATGYRQSTASAVTRDGQTFAGIVYDRVSSAFVRSRAYTWSESSGIRLLPRIGEPDEAMALGSISGDGSVVYGINFGSIVGRAWKWTESSGTVQLSGLYSSSEPVVGGCSADGHWAVGNDFGPSGTTFVRWNKDGAIENLGQPLGASSAGAARVSDDGSVVSGNCSGGSFGSETTAACVWTQSTGNILLVDYLRINGISIPTGTQLYHLTGMSANGKTFAGWAETSEGLGFGFVATVPTPSAVPVLALGFCFLAPRRRR
jgi:hypothetical protein